jgi:hypothetical protein
MGGTAVAQHIPYEEIDPLVRGLVRVLNEEWELETSWSCGGHSPGEEAYVSFRAPDQERVRELLSALPFAGWSAGFAENRPVAKVVWTTVAVDDSGVLRYDLRMSGIPEYARKELIGEIEVALREASPTRRRGSDQPKPRLAATG